MDKYKITATISVDVLAFTETEAIKMAEELLSHLEEAVAVNGYDLDNSETETEPG